MIDKELLEIILLFIPITSGIGAVLCSLNFKQYNWVFRILTLYLWVAFTTDILSRIADYLTGENLVLVPLFGAIEFFLFSCVYYLILFKKWTIRFVLFTLFTLFFLSIEFFQSFHLIPQKFQSYSRVFEGCCILFFAVYYYYCTLKEKIPFHSQLILFNTGTILFFSINSLWHVLINFLINSPTSFIYSIWLINAIALPLYYIFLTLLIWKNGKTLKPLPSGV